MSLVRILHFIAAINNFHIRISHIQGTDNAIADALSRDQMSIFRQLVPHANITMTQVLDISEGISHLQEQYGLNTV